MTMKATGQNGFVMILVIMALAAIGVVMFVLTDDANTMIFESDTAYLRATQRNLTASALAWARHVHLALVEGECSAVLFWGLYFDKKGEALLYAEKSKAGKYEITPKFYTPSARSWWP